MKVLISLLLIDYILTYIGIHRFQVITELNPFMMWIMDLPFLTGFLIRILQSFLIILPVYYVYSKDLKYYRFIIRTGFVIYSIVIILHINWIARIV